MGEELAKAFIAGMLFGGFLGAFIGMALFQFLLLVDLDNTNNKNK